MGSLAFSLCLGFASALPAQQPSFHAETRLVEINVVVRDRNGPVANLKKDDFTVMDRGKTRKIAFFSVNGTGPEADLKNAPLPAGTFSNRSAAPPGVTVILLDALNTLTGSGSQSWEEHVQWPEQLALANARQQLIRFVATLEPEDRVAIYSLGKSLDVLSDFTTDRARLQAILEKYQPVSLSRREDVAPLPVHTPVPGEEFNAAVNLDRQILAGFLNRGRAETTLAALSAIANHVAAIPGRKNLVWLTGNLPFPGAAAARAVGRANVAIYPVDARGLLGQNPPSDLDDSTWNFHHRPVSRPVTEPPGLTTMEDMAWETGGRAYVNTNDLTRAIRSAVDDAAVTYTLGFYLDEGALDGKFHQMKIRVRNATYEVRAPRGYYADREAAVSQNRLVEAIVSPVDSSGIGLVAHVECVAGGLMAITGTADLTNLELSHDSGLHKGILDVMVVQMDTEGKMLDLGEERYNLRLTDPEYASYVKSGILFRVNAKAREGMASLRLVVTVTGGSRIGSLVIAAGQIPGER